MEPAEAPLEIVDDAVRPPTGCKRYLTDLQNLRTICKNAYRDNRRRNCLCIAERGHLELGEMSSQHLSSDYCCWKDKDHDEDWSDDCLPTCLWTHKYFYKGVFQTLTCLLICLMSLLGGWLYVLWDVYQLLQCMFTGRLCEWGGFYFRSIVGLAIRLTFNSVWNLLEALWFFVAYGLAWTLNCCCCFSFGCFCQHLSCICNFPKRCDCCMGGCYQACRECLKAMEDPDSTA